MAESIQSFLQSKYVDIGGISSIPPYPIAICTPMYNSVPFLDSYLNNITSLNYPKRLISLYFTVQGEDDTYDMIQDFKSQFKAAYNNIQIEKIELIREKHLPHIRNVVHCRNLLAQWSNPYPVLFVDHDNFPPPNTIARLQQNLELGASITAGVYVFYKRNHDEPDQYGQVNFTAFFRIKGDLGSVGLSE